jgi:hypothetical protein
MTQMFLRNYINFWAASTAASISKGATIGHEAERLSRSGIDGIDVAAGFRLVLFVAIERIAVLGQRKRFSFDRLNWRRSLHGRFLISRQGILGGVRRMDAGHFALIGVAPRGSTPISPTIESSSILLDATSNCNNSLGN